MIGEHVGWGPGARAPGLRAYRRTDRAADHRHRLDDRPGSDRRLGGYRRQCRDHAGRDARARLHGRRRCRRHPRRSCLRQGRRRACTHHRPPYGAGQRRPADEACGQARSGHRRRRVHRLAHRRPTGRRRLPPRSSPSTTWCAAGRRTWPMRCAAAACELVEGDIRDRR